MVKHTNISYFLNYINPIFYTKEYFKKKKFFEETNSTKADTTSKNTDDATKKAKQENLEFKLKEKTLAQKKESLDYYKQIKKDIESDLHKMIKNVIHTCGYYSADTIEGIYIELKDFNNKSVQNKSLSKQENGYLNMKRWSQRNSMKPYQIKIKPSDRSIDKTRLKAFKLLAKVDNVNLNSSSEVVSEIIKTYINIITLKQRIKYINEEAKIKKRNFLSKVLRVLLYVEDVQAEHLNEKLAKSFFYTRDVNYNFRVRSSSIKVRSLEWTVSSPPPLHTFYVPVRTIVTNDRFYNYKKGKRLLANPNYNFKEMPSIYEKGFRKISKIFYLFRNYVYYALNLKDYSKDNNLWYKGSHYVEESNDYSHTVEYVSQSIRYPYKHLSKYLPFSAGLHQNTISIDLLITPDKSNRTIFGEQKSLLHTKKYLNLNNNFIKPLFIIGDRSNELLEVHVNWLDTNYKNYLHIVNQIRFELNTRGDGFFTAYYLPPMKKNTFFFYLWEMATLEAPKWSNFFYEMIVTVPSSNELENSLFKTDKYEKYDVAVLQYDIFSKWSSRLSWLPSKFTAPIITQLQNLELLRQKNVYVKFFTRDLFDIQDFNHSARFICSYFYIPYLVAKKTKFSFFINYFFRDLIGKPLLAIGWYKFAKADTFIIPNWIQQIKKWKNK